MDTLAIFIRLPFAIIGSVLLIGIFILLLGLEIAFKLGILLPTMCIELLFDKKLAKQSWEMITTCWAVEILSDNLGQIWAWVFAESD